MKTYEIALVVVLTGMSTLSESGPAWQFGDGSSTGNLGFTDIEQLVAAVTVPVKVTGPPPAGTDSALVPKAPMAGATPPSMVTVLVAVALPTKLVALILTVYVMGLVVKFAGIAMIWSSEPSPHEGWSGDPMIVGDILITQLGLPATSAATCTSPPVTERVAGVEVRLLKAGAT